MKLLVIGCGQCGGRIAEEFARLNLRARSRRSINIVTDCFAVNTDLSDLSELSIIGREFGSKLVMGSKTTSGHGVGQINEMSAQIAKEDGEYIVNSISKSSNFQKTEAFLLIASAAGGTGSGAISILTRQLKNSYPDKPVYNLIVLPFKYEEATEERSVYNSATCLKSAYLVADAVFLVDNQRFTAKGLSFSSNINRINNIVVDPFYNLLCAGEEKNKKFVGSRTLDAGDIMQTLSGWTVIGQGKIQHPRGLFRLRRDLSFHMKAHETQDGIQAISSALGDLSLKCEPKCANRALYLLTAQSQKISTDLVAELNNALKQFAPNASIRSGDYPRYNYSLEVAVILSELSNVNRITDLFDKAILYIAARKRMQGKEFARGQISTSFGDIPSLL